MRVLKTRPFARWARREGLGDRLFVAAVAEMQAGLVDAELGGGLFKKRIARAGQGKRGGYRTLVASNRGSRWIFLYGFPKNVRTDITGEEERALKKLAGTLLALSETQEKLAMQSGELIEIDRHA